MQPESLQMDEAADLSSTFLRGRHDYLMIKSDKFLTKYSLKIYDWYFLP